MLIGVEIMSTIFSTLFSTLLTLCSTLLYSLYPALLYSTLLYSIALYSTLPLLKLTQRNSTLLSPLDVGLLSCFSTAGNCQPDLKTSWQLLLFTFCISEFLYELPLTVRTYNHNSVYNVFIFAYYK